MAKTKIYNYNPFSKQLMDLIGGVYSKNVKVASTSFDELVDYFKTDSATSAEVNCLIMTNANYIVKLLGDLSDQPGPHELLRSTVGKVVIDGLSVSFEEDGVDITGDLPESI